MKLVIDKIQKLYSDNGIVINLTIPKEFTRYAEMSLAELKDKKLTVELKEYRNARSLTQNAYLWELLTELSIAYSGSKEKRVVEAIYCSMLEEAQAEYTYIKAIPAVEDSLRKSFRAIRKMGEREDTNPNGQKVKVNIYQVFTGSSKYDTKQMNILIETVQHKLTELGVDYELSTKSL